MPTLPNISPELLSSYQEEMARSQSPATAKRRQSSLRRFFDWAEKEGHIESNPISSYSPSVSPSSIVVSGPKRKILNTKNTLRFGILVALVILILLLGRQLRVPIPFIRTPAQFITTGTPQPQIVPSASPIPSVTQDSDLIIANLKEEITTLVEQAIEWATFENGNLQIGGAPVSSILLSTGNTTDGDITINPDGSGNLNLLFEGNSGNMVNAQNANLTSGSLYYGYIGNNSTSPYLIKLEGGSTPDTKFSVRADGYTTIDGSLNLAGDIQFSGLTRITQTGKLEFITGYLQTSGKFEIEQGTGDFVGITKDLSGSEGPATKDSVILNFSEVNPSSYDTLVLKRAGGTNDAMALFVDEGNAKFDNQLQLGRFSSNPTAIGQGSLIFNTSDTSLYVWNGSSWTALGGGSSSGFWQRLSGVISPVTATDDLAIGGTDSSSPFFVSDGGDVKINGGDLTSTATTFNFDIGNTGTLNFRDGTNTLSAIKDQGAFPFWNLAGKGTTGDPATCAEGDIYYNATDDTVKICHSGNVWEVLDGGAGSSTLQDAYDADVNGADTIVALTTNDDSLIFRNPATGGTDSGYILFLDQLASGAVDDLRLGNSGTGLEINFTSTTPTIGIADTGTLTIEDAGGNDFALFIDQGTTGRLAISDSLQVGSTAVATVAYSRFGTGTTGHGGNITAADDLLITGDQEIDGILFLDGRTISNPAGTAAMVLCTSGGVTCATTAEIENALSSGSWLIENTANVGKAALTVNQTKNGDIFTASASGTPRFTVTYEGDVNIGRAASNDVDVNIYGDIFQQSNSDLTAISNIKDVYIYDTTKDSDGGKWTNEPTSQQLSWYTEAKDDGVNDACVPGTDDRCGRNAFPKKAAIIATTTDVYVFDVLDNTMWMRFTQTGGTFALGADTSNDPSSVHALNGTVYVGTNGASGTGLYALDFRQDKIFRFDSTDRKDTGTGRVTDRNTAVTYGNGVTLYAINSSIVNDVHATLINGKPFVAVATDVDMSVIRPNDFIVYDYSEVSGDDYNTIWITSQGTLYALNETQSQAEIWKNVHTDNASEIAGAPDRTWSPSTIPALTQGAVTIQVSPSALFVDEKQSHYGYGDKIYVAHSKGLTVINDNPGFVQGGSVKYYDTSRITEEMHSSIDGMFPFNEASGSLADASSNANFLEDEVAPTYSVNGVRGTALTFNGTSQFLCSDTNNDGTCDVDTDYAMTTDSFFISAWFKHSTSIVGIDDIVERYFTATPAQGDGYAVYMQSTGQMTFGIDDDATTFPEDSVTSTAAYNDNQWHHLVAVKGGESAADDGGGFLRLYIDGEEAGTADTDILAFGSLSDSATILGVGASCSVGANCSTGTNFWDGSIDELTIGNMAEAMTQQDVRRMYLAGKQALRYRTISVTDATTFTSTTIGDSAETWTPNEFVGSFVEITGGTGVGQTRRIVQNTATVLTVSPAFSTTPDATSDFAMNPNELYGATTTAKAIAVTDGPQSSAKHILVGTNDGSDGGGVTALRVDGDYVTNLYHGNAGRSDDAGTAWGTTANYDDIEALSAHSETLAIGAQDQYWSEYDPKSITEKVDDLSNKTNNTQISLQGALTDTHRQEAGVSFTDNRTVAYQVMRKGWGFITSVAAQSYSETVIYGITYDDTPLVFANTAGRVFLNGATNVDPESLEDCGSNAIIARATEAQQANRTSFLALTYRTDLPAADAAGIKICYTWMAIGTYSQGAIAAAYPGMNTWANGADLAEWYATEDTTLTAGEVVSIDKAGTIKVARSQDAYDPTSVGIIATQPALTIGPETGLTPGYKEDSQSPSGKAVAVALAGRVPVKVSLEGGPIKAGDPLTSSSTPGVAMKATKAGPIIGKAMEDFDGTSTIVALAEKDATMSATPQITEGDSGPEIIAKDLAMAELNNGIGVVMAFVNTSWYDPDALLTDASGFQLRLDEIRKWILETSEQAVERVGAFGDFIAANIKAGAVETEELVVKGASQIAELTVEGFEASTASIEKLTTGSLATGSLSPIPDGDLIIDLKNSAEASESAFGKLIVKGKDDTEVASIDAEGNATFSGEVTANSLYASKIYADEVIATNGTLGVSREEIENMLKEVEENQNLLADISANELESVNEDVYVTGIAAINTLSITKEIALGSDFVIKDNSINTLSSPLKLQSLAIAPIELMAGLVKIDTSGNVQIGGNLYVAGTIETKGLTVKDSTFGDILASIDATGSAEFRELTTDKIIIASDNTEVGSSTLLPGETETNATAGKATIPAGIQDLTIKNNKITDLTLVYVTPTSSTNNQVLFVKRKVGGESFTVGFIDPLPVDVEFNWWIIDIR